MSIAEGLAAGIEDHRQMVGIGLLHQLHQHGGESEHRIDRRSVGPAHRLDRVEGAEDEAGPIDQTEMLEGDSAHWIDLAA